MEASGFEKKILEAARDRWFTTKYILYQFTTLSQFTGREV